jgi:hypothetical protein
VKIKTVADAVQNDELEAVSCTYNLSLEQIGAEGDPAAYVCGA